MTTAEMQSARCGRSDPHDAHLHREVTGDVECHGNSPAAQEAPFVDGWPRVPSLTVTLNGKAIMSMPLFPGMREVVDVGTDYKVWITT